MLDAKYQKISDNKAKAQTLAFFYANQERGFTARAVEKAAGTRAASGYLPMFVKLGLLHQYTNKGQKFYIFNKRNADWADIKNSISRQYKKLKAGDDALSKYLRRVPSVKAAVLSGVFCANPGLECDLVLVGKISKKTLENIVKTAEKEIGQEINYALFNEHEYKMRKDTFDRFMKDIFDNVHFVAVDKVK
ncbi:hypothetical protein KGQ24_00555 [Patescibacteria group bacterium]|nr:hypothetical protein [Patescibacteria group bacterium]